MESTRVLWMMIGLCILLVRTSEARAADKKLKGMDTMSPTSVTPTPLPNRPTTSSGGNETNTTTMIPMMPTMMPMMPTMSSNQIPLTVASTNSSASNYSSIVNSTSPPYVDMYGLNLPKVVNNTQYSENNDTDIMDALPVVPLLDNGNDFGGGDTWIIHKLPNAGPSQPLSMQPGQQGNYGGYGNNNQPPLMQPGQQGNYGCYGNNNQPPLMQPGPQGNYGGYGNNNQPPLTQPGPQGNYGGYGNNNQPPLMQPGPQGNYGGYGNNNQPPLMQPSQLGNYGDQSSGNGYPNSESQSPSKAYEVFVRPAGAYQEDYNKVDNSSGDSSMYKSLDDFFYR